MIVLKVSNGVELRNLNLETSRYGCYPLGYFECTLLRASTLYMENVTNSISRFVIDSRPDRIMHYNAFTNILVSSGSPAAPYFAVLRGETNGVRVTDSRPYRATAHILYAESGTHTNASVERIYTGSGGAIEANYLGAASGASISGV